jgi:multicomponent Na+:H+ antiporter subunit B
LIEEHESVIIRLTSFAVIPFIQLFALYVLFHGHYSPGGGFQGGVLLAVSIVLMRLSMGRERSLPRFPRTLGAVFACAGMLIFFAVGLIPLFYGGVFLDYSLLPIPGMPAEMLRYNGILFAEIGIALAVFGTITVIFDNLAGENW